METVWWDGEVLLKAHKFHHLPSSFPTKSCLFSLFWKTSCLERPHNSKVTLYRFCCISIHSCSTALTTYPISFLLSFSSFSSSWVCWVHYEPWSRWQRTQMFDVWLASSHHWKMYDRFSLSKVFFYSSKRIWKCCLQMSAILFSVFTVNSSDARDRLFQLI